MRAFVLLVATACSAVWLAAGRPDGAPVEACVTQVPQHPNTVPQADNFPFRLNYSSIPNAGYDPGNSYSLKLDIADTAVAETFKGFILQARTIQSGTSDPVNLVGSFVIIDSKSKLLECQFDVQDPISSAGTVTHSNRDSVTSINFLWIAPAQGTGPIQFQFSVVANFSTYWVQSRTQQVFEATAENTIQTLSYAECGQTRACYREPSGCRDAACDYAATWRVLEDQGETYLEVEMLRNRRGWIALGFSDDNLMGNDDVLVCQEHVDGSSVVVKDTYNPSVQYQPNAGEPDQSDIVFQEWSTNNAIILCRFRRLIAGNSNSNSTNDKDLSTGMYYNFFAVGDTRSGSEVAGVGGQHTATPRITTAPRMASDVSKVETERPSNTLIKVHGGFMIFAWYFLAPIGIFLAFFYKESFPSGLWFYGHIAVMIATIVCMFIGLILILVHADGKWIETDGNQLHQIIGIITIVAPCLNVILGFFKGSSDGTYRWLFNLVHGVNGFLIAMMLAMYNVILGLFRLREWTLLDDHHLIRKAMYLGGSAIGFTSVLFFLFNVYRLMYHKKVPRPQELLATGGDDTSQLVKDEGDLTPAPDYICRITFGIVVIAVMLAVAIATIILMILS